MSKKCIACEETIENDAKFCKKCGAKQEEAKVKEETTNTIKTIEPANPEKVPVNGLSITGFVIAIVSLMCCGLTSPIGLIFSIIGLAKGDPEDKTGKGLAIAGIIISSILLILLIVSLFIWNGLLDLIESFWDSPYFTEEWNNIITGFIIR